MGGDNVNNEGLSMVKPHTPYSVKKITLFQKVIDLNVITDISDVYSTPWSSQWMKICKECILNDAPIMSLSIAQSHSLAVNSKGKIFTWGWNDNGQCAKDSMILEVAIK